MQIKTAEFVGSFPEIEKCPEEKYPEYAFIGRSNVGKSSLINMLTNRRKLAKTSGAPGKTRLFNYFIINQSWYLVDLPGYGFAKVSKKERKKWGKMIKQYALERKKLTGMFVLIDSRHSPQQSDLEFMKFLGINAVPFAMIFTKIDKISTGKLKQNIDNYRKEMLKTWDEMPLYFTSSATKHTGKQEILDFIEQANNQPQNL
jgi:GTP-binding protein